MRSLALLLINLEEAVVLSRFTHLASGVKGQNDFVSLSIASILYYALDT
eukprot:COSAG05_NODE_737_length_7636_cov_48.020433_4_plen_49_part_00